MRCNGIELNAVQRRAFHPCPIEPPSHHSSGREYCNFTRIMHDHALHTQIYPTEAFCRMPWSEGIVLRTKEGPMAQVRDGGIGMLDDGSSAVAALNGVDFPAHYVALVPVLCVPPHHVSCHSPAC